MNDTITVADAEARAASLGGTPPAALGQLSRSTTAVMGDRLFVGPLRGREPGLVDACGGYLANPMEQAARVAAPAGVDRRLPAR